MLIIEVIEYVHFFFIVLISISGDNLYFVITLMRACVLHLWEVFRRVDNVWFVLDFDYDALKTNFSH